MAIRMALLGDTKKIWITHWADREREKTSVKNLQMIRKERGLSQSQLADASGISIRMIQYYEQGANDINKAESLTVYKLAKALNCEVADLLELG